MRARLAHCCRMNSTRCWNSPSSPATDWRSIDGVRHRWSLGDACLPKTEHLHSNWTLVDDYPLSREMLAMSRVWQSPDRRERMIAAKGAPEAIVTCAT